jgi:hypothetical protein
VSTVKRPHIYRSKRKGKRKEDTIDTRETKERREKKKRNGKWSYLIPLRRVHHRSSGTVLGAPFPGVSL